MANKFVYELDPTADAHLKELEMERGEMLRELETELGNAFQKGYIELEDYADALRIVLRFGQYGLHCFKRVTCITIGNIVTNYTGQNWRCIVNDCLCYISEISGELFDGWIEHFKPDGTMGKSKVKTVANFRKMKQLIYDGFYDEE